MISSKFANKEILFLKGYLKVYLIIWFNNKYINFYSIFLIFGFKYSIYIYIYITSRCYFFI